MPSRAFEAGFSRVVTKMLTATAVQMGNSVATVSLAGLAKQMRESGARLNRQQQFIVDAVSVKAIPANLRQQLHQDVGRAAQLSVQQAYTHRRHRRNTPPYRTSPRDPRNFRYAGGLLLRALQAPDFFEATPNVLRWGNTARLNQEAKQWRRLNFGAGGAAGESPRQFPMQWGNFVGAAIGLEPDPRPPFRIPTGYWVSGGSRASGITAGAEFYPRGEQPPGRLGRPSKARMTAGIAASNFLDAGVRRIAEEYPKAMSTMVGRLWSDRPTRTRIHTRHQLTVPMPSGVQRFGRLR